jgi:(S)-2-hydroxyglutarate dehydrogenase
VFCSEEEIRYDVCGKVIVAVDERERRALDALHERARRNAVAVEEIGPERLRELEPSCQGAAALHLSETALVDFHEVATALARRLERAGGALRTGTRVTALAESSKGVRISTTRGELLAALVVACAGVHADGLTGKRNTQTRVLPFRGTYFALRPEARALCRNLIYPVPDPRFPFLGVHVNRRPDGEVWAGPNAVVALAREGYRRRDVRLREAWETLSYPGFVRLARRHWRLGALELARDVIRSAYAAQARRYLPDLTADDLVPAPAGIRAQAIARDGTLVDDFLFSQTQRVLHVRNAPSPGATSSLAIARHIAQTALAAAPP